jgi:PrtD family type I secretion system ABC transporter
MGWLFVRRLRRFVLLAAFASLFLNVALLMPSIYMMQVFDRVFSSRSVETLAMLGAITLLFLVFGYFLDTVRVRTLAWAGRSLDRQLAPAAVRASLEQAAANPGRVETDALRDIAQLRAFLSGPGVLAMFDAPWLPAYLLLISLMHPLLGLTAAIGATALVALGVITHRLTREHSDGAMSLSRASARLAEKLARNAEVVIGMGMTRAVIGRWRQQHERLLNAQEQQVLTSSRLSALARTLRQVLQATMLAVGAWLVIDAQASAGIMIAATILLSRALQPAEYLISGWRTLTEARGAWRRLNERPVTRVAEAAVALPAPAGRIDVETLAYAFCTGKPAVIRNLSVSVAPGESLAVIGPSASGKTTLVRLLLGLWRPQTGVVRLDGADISRWDRDALGQHIGYLPQDVEIFAGTVGENIARLADLSNGEDSERIVHAAQLAHAHELILQLPDGYDTQIGEAGAVLSGGQRQRIALARALFGDPRVVVLDEPDANLDAAGENALLAAIADLKSRGTTVIVVSHNPTLMAAVDRILVLKNGALEMFGPAAAVLARMNSAAAQQRVVPFPQPKHSEAHA